MQIYVFDPITKEYLYSEEAFIDPLETVKFVPVDLSEKEKDSTDLFDLDDRIGRLDEATHKVYLLPEHATFDAPPDAQNGYAAKWDGSKWELVEDHRKKIDAGGLPVDGTGTPFWLPGDTWNTPARFMEELGSLPKDALKSVPEKPLEIIKSEVLLEAKYRREIAVSEITVVVDGLVFDGDERAQERMARTVTAATATGASMDDTTTWVLHDNTVATVTIRQLATALRLAGEEQTRLWTVPYEASYTPAEAA